MLLLLLLACRGSEPPAPPAAPPAQEPAAVHHAVEIPAKDPASTALVVAIHGRGDTPERFAPLATGWDEVAQVVLPAGPLPRGRGWSWFSAPVVEHDADLALELARAADRLAAWLAPRRADPLVVTGFSQGGMLSWALAVRHPDLVDYAVPMGGMLPSALWPEDVPAEPPGILALHGADDEVVPTARDAATAAALEALGWPVRLRTWPGVGHAFTAEMHDEADRAVRAAATGRDPLAGATGGGP